MCCSLGMAEEGTYYDSSDHCTRGEPFESDSIHEPMQNVWQEDSRTWEYLERLTMCNRQRSALAAKRAMVLDDNAGRSLLEKMWLV